MPQTQHGKIPSTLMNILCSSFLTNIGPMAHMGRLFFMTVASYEHHAVLNHREHDCFVPQYVQNNINEYKSSPRWPLVRRIHWKPLVTIRPRTTGNISMPWSHLHNCQSPITDAFPSIWKIVPCPNYKLVIGILYMPPVRSHSDTGWPSIHPSYFLNDKIVNILHAM